MANICTYTSNLFSTAAQHADDADTDGADTKCRGPVLIQDGETDVTITVNVRMDWDSVPYEGYLYNGGHILLYRKINSNIHHYVEGFSMVDHQEQLLTHHLNNISNFVIGYQEIQGEPIIEDHCSCQYNSAPILYCLHRNFCREKPVK